MLFSRKEIADYINENFEPVWQSVRPVPMVTIDFGQGRKLTRTLNGNIASYVLAFDGRILDVIPGIYEPETYLKDLGELRALAKLNAKQILAYHKHAHHQGPSKVSKIENLETTKIAGLTAIDRGFFDDTRTNEGLRRSQIHRRLAEETAYVPGFQNWLYRQVLHCDLEDPYLGMGFAAPDKYPFTE